MALMCTVENNLRDFATLDGKGRVNITIIASGNCNFLFKILVLKQGISFELVTEI